MWLTSSSIGRKLVMAITGACLILFVTFHVAMNAVCIFWPTAYNQICMFLGANWYALIASAGLAALFIIHIIYAVWLTIQNRHARGDDRYLVTSRPPQVEWASKNMLVLGIVILAFLVVHMIQFWAKMQLNEIISHNPADWYQVDGAPVNPAMGTLLIGAAFKCWWTPVIYIIGFIALWFHMNHGFWSMFHTAGWDNNIWIKRLKAIGLWWTSIVVALFCAQAIVFYVNAQSDFYTKDLALQKQYAEQWVNKAEAINADFQEKVQAKAHEMGLDKQPTSQEEYIQMQQKLAELNSYIASNLAMPYIKEITPVLQAINVQAPDVVNQKIEEVKALRTQVVGLYNDIATSDPQLKLNEYADPLAPKVAEIQSQN